MTIKKGRRKGRTSFQTTDVIKKTIEFFGSQRIWAEALGLTPTAVNKQVRRGIIPAKYAREMERLTKSYLTKEEIRPDLYKK